jgi:hypothetical protein
MKGVVNLTRWVLSICLLIGAIFRIDIFSIIYALLFLAIPWAFIHSTVARLRFFFILALVSLITSTFFLLMISAVHIYSVTTKGKDLFSNECSFNVRILQHIGFIIWAHTTNRVLFVLSLVIDVIIVCKKICFYFE